jgi:DNA-binding response OmpR family regulator
MPTLLIVEDDVNIRKFVVTNLLARGYEVIEAGSAEEGLNILRDTSPEALLLDIKLPGMSGWTMLDLMADASDILHLPVIVMTASAYHDNGDKGRYTNIVKRLPKPVALNELMQAIESVVEPYNEQNNSPGR